MTTDLDILNEMINDVAKENLTQIRSGNSLTVKLIEPKASDSTVTIKGLPHASIVIKIDSFPDLRSIFNGARGERSRADYAIVSESGKSKFIVHIEMKKTKVTQTKSSINFGVQCVL